MVRLIFQRIGAGQLLLVKRGVGDDDVKWTYGRKLFNVFVDELYLRSPGSPLDIFPGLRPGVIVDLYPGYWSGCVRLRDHQRQESRSGPDVQ